VEDLTKAATPPSKVGQTFVFRWRTYVLENGFVFKDKGLPLTSFFPSYSRNTLLLSNRCPLDIPQLITFLEMCLSSTYFTYQTMFYKQEQGAAMGFPISPVVANLHVEHFESRALVTAPPPPATWYRYVDDTMAKINKYALHSFSDHLNAID